MPPSWDKAAVWAQAVKAVSFLHRGKVQSLGRGLRQGGIILTMVGRVSQTGTFQVLPLGAHLAVG